MFKAVLLAFSVFFALFSFQNCAPQKQQQVIESSSNGLVLSSSVNVSGRCGSTLNSCASGDFLNIADSSTHSWWRCNGSGSGASVSCSTSITSAGPIPGLCSTNLNSCLQGDLLDVADTSTQYVWNCRGVNTGSTALCTFNKPTNPNAITGQCGANNNSCLSGTLADLLDSTTEFLWECRGSSGGATSNCSQLISTAPVIGVCNNTREACISGDFEDQPDSQVNFVWNCRGRNNGATNQCSISKPTCTISNNPNSPTSNTPANIYFQDNYTYNVRATSGSLPTRISIQLQGTRTNLNNTGTVTDTSPDTSTLFNITSNQNITRTFSAAADAGIYTRSAKIFDTDTQKELCRTTNAVTHNLLPLCTLGRSVANIDLSQTIVFNAVFPATGHVELGATPASVIWYSTRTTTVSGTTSTVRDEFDNNTMSVSSFPRSFTPGTGNPQLIGTYNRYFVARDSSSRPLCRSNSITFDITAMPVTSPPSSGDTTIGNGDESTGGGDGNGTEYTGGQGDDDTEEVGGGFKSEETTNNN